MDELTRQASRAALFARVCEPNLLHAPPAEWDKHVEWVEDECRRFVCEAGLAPDELTRKRHESARVASLAARTYPDADAESLLLVAKWISINLLLDDLFDRSDLGFDAESVSKYSESVLSCLPVDGVADNGRATGNPLIDAYRHLWNQTVARMSLKWQSRFVRHFREFLDSCSWEAENRLTGRIPGLEEYIAMRGRALHPYLDLIEVTTGAELPDENEQPSDLAELHRVVSDVDLWTNDLFSFAQEAERGDPHNLVTVYARAHEQRQADSLDAVIAMVQERIDTATRLSSIVERTSISGLTGDEIARHVSALRGWTIGQLAWRNETDRCELTRETA